jgi:hypothetical protein
MITEYPELPKSDSADMKKKKPSGSPSHLFRGRCEPDGSGSLRMKKNQSVRLYHLSHGQREPIGHSFALSPRAEQANH